jgi:hypothetical protein
MTKAKNGQRKSPSRKSNRTGPGKGDFCETFAVMK